MNVDVIPLERMKFNLLHVLLIVALIAALTAWHVERSRNAELVASYKQEFKDVTDGALMWGFEIREHAILSLIHI